MISFVGFWACMDSIFHSGVAASDAINGSSKIKKKIQDKEKDKDSLTPRIVDSSSSDSEGGGASKKRKSVEKEDKKSDPAPAPTTTIKFSDDSDDDFACATANASKTFDDLLKDDKHDLKSGSGDDKEVGKETEKDEDDPLNKL